MSEAEAQEAGEGDEYGSESVFAALMVIGILTPRRGVLGSWQAPNLWLQLSYIRIHPNTLDIDSGMITKKAQYRCVSAVLYDYHLTPTSSQIVPVSGNE